MALTGAGKRIRPHVKGFSSSHFLIPAVLESWVLLLSLGNGWQEPESFPKSSASCATRFIGAKSAQRTWFSTCSWVTPWKIVMMPECLGPRGRTSLVIGNSIHHFWCVKRRVWWQDVSDSYIHISVLPEQSLWPWVCVGVCMAAEHSFAFAFLEEKPRSL